MTEKTYSFKGKNTNRSVQKGSNIGGGTADRTTVSDDDLKGEPRTYKSGTAGLAAALEEARKKKEKSPRKAAIKGMLEK